MKKELDMLFPTFIGTISYNCRDNRNKVSYHGWGQSKKILKNTYSLLKNSFQKKTHFKRKPVKWFVSQIEWLVSLWCKSNDWFLRFFSKDFKFYLISFLWLEFILLFTYLFTSSFYYLLFYYVYITEGRGSKLPPSRFRV